MYRRSPQPGLIIVYLRIKVTALWLCPTWLLFHNSAAHCVPLHFPRRVLACTGTRSRCPWAAQNDPLSVSIVVLRCTKIRLANPKEFTQANIKDSEIYAYHNTLRNELKIAFLTSAFVKISFFQAHQIKLLCERKFRKFPKSKSFSFPIIWLISAGLWYPAEQRSWVLCFKLVFC